MILAAVGSASLLALIARAVAQGRFWQEGGELFALAWGRVTLADLYLGFTLFSCWVIFREKSTARALVCVALTMTLGNAFTAAYALAALVGSRGSWSRFWLGHRRHTEGTTP
jgi:hypothetical protein